MLEGITPVIVVDDSEKAPTAYFSQHCEYWPLGTYTQATHGWLGFTYSQQAVEQAEALEAKTSAMSLPKWSPKVPTPPH